MTFCEAWSEAQSEVVTSRILWAIGFHQPATDYLERWTLAGAESGPQPAVDSVLRCKERK